MLISLSNLFYKIELDEKDLKLLTKSFKNNKKFLLAMKVAKKDFDIEIMRTVNACLKYKYLKG